MTRRLTIIQGVLICVVVLATGCGGSDPEGNPRAEYIAKADAICVTQNRMIQEVGSATHVEKVLIPKLNEAIRDLRRLVPPPGDARQIEEFLAAMELMVNRAENSPTYVAKASRPFLRTELMGKRYGFEVCGSL